MSRPKRRPVQPRLVEYRQSVGLTQEQVAERIGITPEMVRRHERGVSLPSPVYRERYCELYGVDAYELGLVPSQESPLRAARAWKGWSQAEAVEQIRQVSDDALPEDLLNTYKRWESGRCRPSPFYADLLVKVFGPIEGLPLPKNHAAPAVLSPDAQVPARSRLRDARDANGWTLEQTATRLIKLAESRGVAISASRASLRQMICEMERGRRKPGHYQPLLCELFDRTPDELGFMPLAPVPTPVGRSDQDSMGELVTALLRVLQSGANLVIGIAPSDTLATAINRQGQLDTTPVVVGQVPLSAAS